MKKILAIIVFSFLLTGNISAEIKILEEKYILSGSGNSIWYKTICVDGYKFFYSDSATKQARAQTSTQIFEVKDGKSLPAKC